MTDQPHVPAAPQPTQPPQSGPAGGYPGAYSGGYAAQQPAYGARAGYAGPPAAGVGSPWGPLAGWGTRVLAMLVDSLLSLVGMIPYIVGVVLIISGSPDTSSYETPAGPSADETNTGLIITGVILVVLGLLVMLGIHAYVVVVLLMFWRYKTA